MSLARFFSCFAAGYLLSYFYRNVNAVISPELTLSLGLSPSTLGLLTSAYFVAFGAVQLPVGMLLDRFGPRRVEPGLLIIAGCGALLFAISDFLTSLVLARGLIGLGVAACLMAPLKGLSTWFPVNRQASLAGWMMVAGGIGALLSTAPLEWALHYINWRTVFVVLAMATFAAAAAIFRLAPDTKPPVHALGWRSQWQGVRAVFSHPRFWWLAPLAALGMGSFMAIQSLWSVPWMMEVNGMPRADAARHLLVLGLAVLAGHVSVGLFATRLGRRGISAVHLFAAGYGVNVIALAVIVADWAPGSSIVWGLYGAGVAVNILGFTVLSSGFPHELAGRTNTALNLLMFGSSFVLQWGIGVVTEFSQTYAGSSAAEALHMAFMLVLGVNVFAFAWFVAGWRRFAQSPKPEMATS